ALFEEAPLARPRPVDELVDEDEVARLDLPPHRPHGRDRDDALAAERAEAVDVRAERDLGGREPVPAAVAREERDLDAAEVADDVCVGRRAEGRLDLALLTRLEALEVVEAAAADDPD